MPTDRTLPQATWQQFFHQLSKSLAGQSAEIEVSALDLGDQIVAEWIPLIGITYEPDDRVLDVALERLDHLIHEPTEIVVQEDASRITSIAVVDEDGTKQVIRLKSPLALPAAAG